ncbi:MAG: hypothetical protein ACR2OO_05395 [Thermomicrobiales bacterium]
MSVDAFQHSPITTRVKLGACALAALMAVGMGSGSLVRAQDATPAASPTAMSCDAPALPPGAPSTPGASPAAAMEMATPVPAAGATPVPAPAGTAADAAAGAEITATVENIVGCIAAGKPDSAVALMTPHYIKTQFGSDNPYDVVENLKGFAFADFTNSNPMTYADGGVSADVQYMTSQTKYQLNSERWFFTKDGEYSKLDAQTFISASTDLDTAVVGVNLTQPEPGKYAIEPNRPSATVSPALVFHAINAGTEAHELIVFKLPAGKDAAGLLDGSIPQSDVEYIGGISPLAPGQEGDLTLVNLPAGVYTMACFFDGPDGKPHAANGMVAQFEVTAAT